MLNLQTLELYVNSLGQIVGEQGQLKELVV